MKKRMLGWLLFCLLLALPTGAWAEEKTPYSITVNLTKNIVTVYEQGADGMKKPIKAFLCSGGWYTPEGTFRTTAKYDWRYLFGDVWGQYATRITGHYLFHSVPYFEKDKSTLEYKEYNKLGTTASAGCIRLTVEDAKWIYDNCPVGTTVSLYRGEVQEPLQPAPAQKLSETDTSLRGWDPTDPDSRNPWRKGTLREMYSPALGKAVMAYYEGGTYYVSPAVGAELFSALGVALELPWQGEQTEQQLTLISGGKSHLLHCRWKDGTVYYKLRDVAAMAGAELTWDGKTKEMFISKDWQSVTLVTIA